MPASIHIKETGQFIVYEHPSEAVHADAMFATQYGVTPTYTLLVTDDSDDSDDSDEDESTVFFSDRPIVLDPKLLSRIVHDPRDSDGTNSINDGYLTTTISLNSYIDQRKTAQVEVLMAIVDGWESSDKSSFIIDLLRNNVSTRDVEQLIDDSLNHIRK